MLQPADPAHNDRRTANQRGHVATSLAAAAVLFMLNCGSARAQSLGVLPVTIQLSPGQAAVSLTIVNQGSAATSVQVRAYAWSQSGPDGDEVLTSSSDVATSPPLATIGPAGTQIVRMVLRQLPQDKEATYRILIDQIPAPTQPGVVQVVLRLSIPVFAEPPANVVPRLAFHVERELERVFLVGVNEGKRHEKLRDIEVRTTTGATLKPEGNVSPYILAGATRRWVIADVAQLPAGSGTLRVSAQTDTGVLDQAVVDRATP